MSILNFLLVTVLVGLINGNQVTIQDAQFLGFLESRDDGQTFLFYRQGAIHGQLSAESIARIDLGYRKGQPFPLTVTLKNGERMDLFSDRRDFVRIRGTGLTGGVTVQHPDPVAPPLRLTTRPANRADDLTIQFLEFR